MRRRTAALAAAATALAAALAGCSTGDSAAPATAPAGATTAPSGSAPASSAAAPAAGHAPAKPFAVGVRTLALSRGADRPLKTTVWYPATGPAGGQPTAGRAVAPGPFPLVLFSHGLTAQPSDYAGLVLPWVRAGFVVAAPAYPHTSTGVRDYRAADILNQPADASQVITAVLALNAKRGDALQGRIDAARIAAAGHSAGGITTVGMLSGNRDDRLDAGMVLSGRQLVAAPFTGAAVPVLFVHGKKDATVKYTDGLTAFRALPWPKALLTVTDGGHITTGRGLTVVIDTSTDFLRWSLYGDAAARARMPKEATRFGVATLTDKF